MVSSVITNIAILAGCFITIVLVVFIPGLFLILTLTSISDIIKYKNDISREKKQINANPNGFYKDSVNFRMFNFIRNSLEKEPYLIYFRQKIVSIMFLSILLIITIIVVAGAIIILVYLVTNAKPKPVSGGADIPSFNTDNMMAISVNGMIKSIPIVATSSLLLLCMPFLYNHVYNKNFLGDVHSKINKNILDVNILGSSIYDNIIRDSNFLESIIDNDVDKSIQIINNQGTNYDRIGSMIFTLSLYNKYKASSEENDFISVNQIFSVDQLTARTISPAEYLTNKQPQYIYNLMDSIEERITNVLTTKNKVRIVKENVARRINKINELIVRTLIPRPAQESVIKYLWNDFALNIIPFVLISAAYAYMYREHAKGK